MATALQLAEYGGEEESSWVLLEPVALAAAETGSHRGSQISRDERSSSRKVSFGGNLRGGVDEATGDDQL